MLYFFLQFYCIYNKKYACSGKITQRTPRRNCTTRLVPYAHMFNVNPRWMCLASTFSVYAWRLLYACVFSMHVECVCLVCVFGTVRLRAYICMYSIGSHIADKLSYIFIIAFISWSIKSKLISSFILLVRIFIRVQERDTMKMKYATW